MKNVVTIGGGTGSAAILRGLKNIPNLNISAIVSMADDGGANGMLRRELGVLPPSDARQCLIALAPASNPVAKLLGYRFSKGTLSGHSFGSLFIAALEMSTGDFTQAVTVASKILNVKEKILPVSKDKAVLGVLLQNGKKLETEHVIDEADLQKSGVTKIFYKRKVRLSAEAKKALHSAKYAVICPGDFYTSLAPNFIVEGFKSALQKSRAKIILFVNLVNKAGHTSGWQASDYVKNIEKYLGKKADFILVNNYKPKVKDDLGSGSRVIRVGLKSSLIYKNDKGDFMNRSTVRHDPKKVASLLKKILK